ncbi:TPA: hypothetical protein P0N70_003720 [Yersinia enterocolitica]|nr:hypothetical protein CH49_2913 [Yersinia enterocolitica]CRY28717.1 Uncharacterised protein [Yersinia enterocolitica]HDL8282107.1 hypothetical protein [Yersinia enterocolitica]HDM8291805.1 hypothetical protein [Yersinia enterocolitica]HDM8295802.1 hypothetical protein [Yersinia enterocolitica]
MNITTGVINHYNQTGLVIAKPTVRTAIYLQHPPVASIRLVIKVQQNRLVLTTIAALS